MSMFLCRCSCIYGLFAKEKRNVEERRCLIICWTCFVCDWVGVYECIFMFMTVFMCLAFVIFESGQMTNICLQGRILDYS